MKVIKDLKLKKLHWNRLVSSNVILYLAKQTGPTGIAPCWPFCFAWIHLVRNVSAELDNVSPQRGNVSSKLSNATYPVN